MTDIIEAAASKEAGAPGKEIEITPEMIEAGVRVLASEWGVIGEVAAEELAEDVYRAMSAIRALKPASPSPTDDSA